MAKNENSWGMWSGIPVQIGDQVFYDTHPTQYSAPNKGSAPIDPNSTINTIYGPYTINHMVELINKSSHIIKQLETRIAALELELKDSVWVDDEENSKL